MPNIRKEMEAVIPLLGDAEAYGLQVEVVTWALKYMKEDPTLTIAEAMRYGYDEWVK